MSQTPQTPAADVRARMTEIGGRMAQDLGLSRILGQILVHLYLQREAQSLETIAANLGLSKAAISIAVRQLETLGLVHRVWVKGDRRNYYRTADNIGMALQKGLFSVLNQKIQILATELDAVGLILDQTTPLHGAEDDADFLRQRIKRTQELRDRVDRLLNNRLVKWMAGM